LYYTCVNCDFEITNHHAWDKLEEINNIHSDFEQELKQKIIQSVEDIKYLSLHYDKAKARNQRMKDELLVADGKLR
jgi:hypothetical protein